MDSNGKMPSLEEVAYALRMSCDTVRRLIKAGYLQGGKLPKRKRWRQDSSAQQVEAEGGR